MSAIAQSFSTVSRSNAAASPAHPILHNFTPETLSAAITRSRNATFATWSGLPGRAVHEDAAIMWYDAGIALPPFSGVTRTHFAPDTADAAIEATLALFAARGAPVAWWAGPDSRPADLRARLEAHGLTHVGDTTGMAIDLRTMRDEPPPAGLTIAPVGDRATMEHWVQVLCNAFQVPNQFEQAMFDLFAAIGLGDHAPWRFYLGWLDGEPVATSALLPAQGVAGIYNVGTLEGARRRGIGTAIVRAPLLEARALGYRIGVLESSQAGLSVYRALGFQAYHTVALYTGGM